MNEANFQFRLLGSGRRSASSIDESVDAPACEILWKIQPFTYFVGDWLRKLVSFYFEIRVIYSYRDPITRHFITKD